MVAIIAAVVGRELVRHTWTTKLKQNGALNPKKMLRSLWNSTGRAQGDPGHLENDSFASEPRAPNFASNLAP